MSNESLLPTVARKCGGSALFNVDRYTGQQSDNRLSCESYQGTQTRQPPSRWIRMDIAGRRGRNDPMSCKIQKDEATDAVRAALKCTPQQSGHLSIKGRILNGSVGTIASGYGVDSYYLLSVAANHNNYRISLGAFFDLQGLVESSMDG